MEAPSQQPVYVSYSACSIVRVFTGTLPYEVCFGAGNLGTGWLTRPITPPRAIIPTIETTPALAELKPDGDMDAIGTLLNCLQWNDCLQIKLLTRPARSAFKKLSFACSKIDAARHCAFGIQLAN